MCAKKAGSKRFQLRGRVVSMQTIQSRLQLRFIPCLSLLILTAIVCLPRTAFAATKVITDADKGSEIHLKVGDRLEVRLKANPSTGFMWYIEKGSTPLLKLVHQTQTEPVEAGVGRPVEQVFTFEAKSAGEGKLLLHYVRSWEPPSPDDERFEIHLVIE
jgi:inhibitor of cysteine peptidase